MNFVKLNHFHARDKAVDVNADRETKVFPSFLEFIYLNGRKDLLYEENQLDQGWANFSPQGPQSQMLCFRGPHSKLPRLFQNQIVIQ